MNATLSSAAKPLCAVVILFVGISQAPAQSVLSIHNEATGTTGLFTPGNASFSVSGDGKALNLLVDSFGDDWFLRFEAPEGETLSPGVYLQAGCPFGLRMGRAPGLGVTDNNPVCSSGLGLDNLWGSFAIRQIAYDAVGQVTSLEAVFTQRKGSANAPALGGLVRYEAKPLSLVLKSDPGFGWGAIAQANHGDTSLFELEGTAVDGLEYRASVLKDTWHVSIEPPTGRQLRARSYRTKGAADPASAGLRIRRGLGAILPACEDPSGQLDIQQMQVNAAGVIQSLRASFAYRCGGTAPALRGTIRYLE